LERSEYQLTAKCFSGLEGVLASELTELGAAEVVPMRRAVRFQGNQETIVKANLWSRTALSILREVHSFHFSGKEEFYEQMRVVEWDRLFGAERVISVVPVAHRSELFQNTMFLGQLTKDGIVDHFRDKTGVRPSVHTRDAEVRIHVFVNNDHCVVSLDSSGDPLFKRGYRRDGLTAPLNESLSAGLVLLSGWDRRSNFIDPMCGSGTIAVEAAMLAANMAPGSMRKTFGFHFWKDFDQDLHPRLLEEARQQQQPVKASILASDVNVKGLDTARQNVMNAGFLGPVTVQRNDFFAFTPPPGGGWLVMNPPYGHRIRQDNVAEFYKRIGDTFKQHYQGFHAGIISQELNGVRNVGLKPKARHKVFNGPLECLFVVYELFAGTHKEHVTSTRPKRPRLP
jgi:putative N6-adenine-specific DNA methylase